jgi:hypothetical protein
VGGDVLDTVLPGLARGARVVICGAISQYNAGAELKGPANYLSLLVNRATMQGFVVFDYSSRYGEALQEMAGWLAEGKLRSKETVVDGGVGPSRRRCCGCSAARTPASWCCRSDRPVRGSAPQTGADRYVPDVTLRRLVLPLALLVALLAGLVGLPSPLGPTQADAAQPTSGQSTYVPLEPVRLLDTRTGGVRLGAGGTLDLPVVDGVRVPAGATAVVLNVTATDGTAVTDVRVFPTPADGGAGPLVNSLSVGRGATAANLVHVGIGASGSVRPPQRGGRRAPRGRPVRLLRRRRRRGVLRRGLPGAAARHPHHPHPAGGGRGPHAAGPRRCTGRAGRRHRGRAQRDRGGRHGADRRAGVAHPPRAAADRQQPQPGAPPRHPGRRRGGDRCGRHGVAAQQRRQRPPGRRPVRLVRPEPRRRRAGRRVPAGAADPAARHRSSTPVGPGEARALTVAGAGAVPAPGSAVVLTVTASLATGPTNVRVYPKVVGGAVPTASNLNPVPGQAQAGTVVAQVGADGQVLLRNAAGSLHLTVDLAGWFVPAGNGWDISWPQCTAPTAPTGSRLPVGGAFSVVGLTRSVPFTDNPCFAAQWAWADSLPGEPMVYINVSAPGVRDGAAVGNRVWQEVCGTGRPDHGVRAGLRRADLGVRRPAAADGQPARRPADGLARRRGAVRQRAVLADRLRRCRRREPRGDPGRRERAAPRRLPDRHLLRPRQRAGPEQRLAHIVGDWRLTHLQNWVFRSPDADPRTVCGPVHSFTGGPVVMAQVQPATSPGAVYDVNGLC